MTKPKTAKTGAPPAEVDKSRIIAIGRKEGETNDQAVARMVVRGTVGNASTVIDYSRTQHAGLSLTDIARALKDQGEAVNSGDLASLERMLNGQAVALNAMFTELARRAALNMGEHLDATERYIRLALKAQSQSRATVETLAVIKNPPVFARQANIANGPQQVNNGPGATSARAYAHAGETESTPNEQSRARHELLEDTRASKTPGGTHPDVAPVGEVHWPTNA